MTTILVVDDEARMRKIIKDFLSMKNFHVLEAENGEQAVDIFLSTKGIDLVILDVMMPKMDGWETCKAIRRYSDVPVIMLTALGTEGDELTGFKLGADEYISKPFSPKILVARVEALLKRTHGAEGETKQVGDITFNRETRSVSIKGQPIELSYKEFELLGFFIDNIGLALSRDKILNHVWDFDYFGDVRTVDTHVKKLRGKLLSCADYITTIRGVGYKFEVTS